MELQDLEFLIFRLIFAGGGPLCDEVFARLKEAKVIGRIPAGVGFLVTVRFSSPLSSMPAVAMHEFNFQHPAFPHGGSFMCLFESLDTVGIEAVAFGGAQWPEDLDFSDFSELS